MSYLQYIFSDAESLMLIFCGNHRAVAEAILYCASILDGAFDCSFGKMRDRNSHIDISAVRRTRKADACRVSSVSSKFCRKRTPTTVHPLFDESRASIFFFESSFSA